MPRRFLEQSVSEKGFSVISMLCIQVDGKEIFPGTENKPYIVISFPFPNVSPIIES
jgi:hypothetical protein